MATHTISVNFDSPRFLGKEGEIIVKLMMACNDLVVADQALADWNAEERKERISRRAGARMYFLRLQIAHLYEALKIIDQIKLSRKLSAFADSCDSATKAAYRSLLEYATDGSQRKHFEIIAGGVRSNLVFHYNENGKLIKNAISDRAGRAAAQYSLITRGSTAHLWYFEAADALVDSIMIRQIWKIPRPADLHAEADRVAAELNRVCLCFLDFAGVVIWRYCEG